MKEVEISILKYLYENPNTSEFPVHIKGLFAIPAEFDDKVYNLENRGLIIKKNDIYNLTEAGLRIVEPISNKENLEIQKLRTEVDLLTNQLLDYSKVKANSKIAIIIAAISAILSGLVLLK